MNSLDLRAKRAIETLLADTPVRLNGDNPWDIQVLNDNFYRRVLIGGTRGFGEAYMDGWWTCERLDEMTAHLNLANVGDAVQGGSRQWLQGLWRGWMNLQSKRRAFQVADAHYNLGNDLFRAMLDPSMNYSCGYWKDSNNLTDAQIHKCDLVCQKLYLKPGMRLLDIGCGWGALAHHAATHYGVEVVGVTVSKEQHHYATEHCRDLPVTIRLQDYRELNESFDRVVSIGMFEHVGYKNYRVFMEVVHRCLAPQGLFLLHTIGNDTRQYHVDPWIDKYIFPNGMLPAISQIGEAIEGYFVMEDWHNFGLDYDKTLMAWEHNFQQHWPTLKTHYDDRFYRMWRFYLLTCAGTFRARKMQLWQIVLSRDGFPQGYQSPR